MQILHVFNWPAIVYDGYCIFLHWVGTSTVVFPPMILGIFSWSPTSHVLSPLWYSKKSTSKIRLLFLLRLVLLLTWMFILLLLLIILAAILGITCLPWRSSSCPCCSSWLPDRLGYSCLPWWSSSFPYCFSWLLLFTLMIFLLPLLIFLAASQAWLQWQLLRVPLLFSW